MQVVVQDVALIAVLLAAAILGVRVAVRMARRLRQSYRALMEAWRRRPPRRTLRCEPRSPAANWWEIPPLDGRPTLKLVSDWQVTNVSTRTVRILRAEAERPKLGWTRLIHSAVSVQRPEGGLFGDFDIAPGTTVSAVVESWFARPERRPDDRLTTRVIFVDSLGNRHVVPRVSFVSLAGLRAARPAVREGVGSGERGSTPRRRVRAPVDFSTDVLVERTGMTLLARARFLVLSACGACLEVGRDYPVGSTLNLRFRLPATGDDIACQTIVRNGRGRSVGVEFVNLAADQSDRIDAFVERQQVRLT